MSNRSMKELIEFVLSKALPEGTDFKVTQSEDENGVVFNIHVPEEYRGKIIGRAGKNIKALRDVMLILAKHNEDNRRILIKIAD